MIAATGSTGRGSAHAKAILLGEHAVVYGAPAIAVPLPRLEVQAEIRATPGDELRIDSELYSGTADMAPESLRLVSEALQISLGSAGSADDRVRLTISSAIPHGRGLGSSAAVATAIARAAADFRDLALHPETCHDIVRRSERIAHGNPSGIDARAVAAAGPIRFQAGDIETVRVGAPLTFVIADSGVPGSTAEAVGGVRDHRAADPSGIDSLLSRLSRLAEGSISELRSGDRAALGERMSEAHELLHRLGVSTPRLDALVAAARSAGATGAKLTGGGLGGCVLALADSEEAAEQIATVLRDVGAARTWTTTVPAA